MKLDGGIITKTKNKENICLSEHLITTPSIHTMAKGPSSRGGEGHPEYQGTAWYSSALNQLLCLCAHGVTEAWGETWLRIPLAILLDYA